MNTKNNLAELEKILDVTFKKKELLNQALTHSSYANENMLPRSACYENLEFFGDSILAFAVSESLLFNNLFKNEGDLSKNRAKLVCEDALYQISLHIGLEPFVKVGGAVTKIEKHIPKSILADIIEAIIAAIYLDSDLETAKKFIHREISWLISTTNILSNDNTEPKSRLQEYVQKKYKILPTYKLKDHVKLDHDNMEIFHVMIYVKDKFVAVGSGRNHKLAEKNAAENALNYLEKHNIKI